MLVQARVPDMAILGFRGILLGFIADIFATSFQRRPPMLVIVFSSSRFTGMSRGL